MNKLLLSTSFVALLGAPSAYAEPSFMLGGTLSFGRGQDAQFGVSARILSNNLEDEGVAGVGATYYPSSGDIGYDVFAGWNLENSVLGIGYDFGQRRPIFSIGYSDTEKSVGQVPSAPASPPPPPPPPPPPQLLSPGQI